MATATLGVTKGVEQEMGKLIDGDIHFSSRDIWLIECPNCLRKQQTSRDTCYCCGLKFVYEDDNK